MACRSTPALVGTSASIARSPWSFPETRPTPSCASVREATGFGFAVARRWRLAEQGCATIRCSYRSARYADILGLVVHAHSVSSSLPGRFCAQRNHAEIAHRHSQRSGRGGADHVTVGSTWRRSQLGLSLHMDSRRKLCSASAIRCRTCRRQRGRRAVGSQRSGRIAHILATWHVTHRECLLGVTLCW